jgi:very-short-patch-repair endonuclease
VDRTRLRARELRNTMSRSEWRLWLRLRKRSIRGFRFRRQVPIQPFIVDFACLSERLAVEVDGDRHEQPDLDATRTEFLCRRGWRVIRFGSDQVVRSLDWVVEQIEMALVDWNGCARGGAGL